MTHQCLWTEAPRRRLCTRQVVHDFGGATLAVPVNDRSHHRLLFDKRGAPELSEMVHAQKGTQARACTTAPRTRALWATRTRSTRSTSSFPVAAACSATLIRHFHLPADEQPSQRATQLRAAT